MKKRVFLHVYKFAQKYANLCFHVLKKSSAKAGRNLQCFLKDFAQTTPKTCKKQKYMETLLGQKHANFVSPNPGLMSNPKKNACFFFVLDLEEGQGTNFFQNRRFATVFF